MRLLFLFALNLTLLACNHPATVSETPINKQNPIDYQAAIEASYRFQTLQNPGPFIPSQCYTKTQDTTGKTHNPCYTCHTPSIRPNYIQDGDLQLGYDFSEDMRTNHWRNLFRDRSAQMNSISDQQITEYIRSSNYFDKQGRISLQQTLQHPPKLWDANSNQQWDGFVPDAWFNFDDQGFDHDRQGLATGWRSFAYYPFPGTFWPTNGSTNDVLIRLDTVFRQNTRSQYDPVIYAVNLAIVEAMIREQNIPIEPVDEALLGDVDINKDGKIGIAAQVTYDWAPLKQRHMWYVGRAYQLQQQDQLQIAAGLFPVGTEFLHTVRYVDTDDKNNIKLSPRIKEVRYARKRQWLNYSWLRDRADAEVKEKHDFPDRLRSVRGNHEIGVTNGQGWTYAGFIEDAKGSLRPQTHEELSYCVGCHGGIGATRDGIFSFPRRFGFASHQHGWFHWSQHSIRGAKEPKRIDGQGEYTLYLQNNHAADEFRANQEVIQRFFNAEGKINNDQLASMQNDISRLLWPSPQRARQLNRAYKLIVEEQSFIHGRDTLPQRPQQVQHDVKKDQSTGIESVQVSQPLAP